MREKSDVPKGKYCNKGGSMNKNIIIDEKVASALIHHISHWNLDYIPKEIQQMKFCSITGKETSFYEIAQDLKNRLGTIENYLRIARRDEYVNKVEG